ncbi:MAG: substrate-binding domain-containing protein [Cyanobacteriota bacterium]|nr:substrate-binding domain-containing protein [Cyanobacteriota bacterium]
MPGWRSIVLTLMTLCLTACADRTAQETQAVVSEETSPQAEEAPTPEASPTAQPVGTPPERPPERPKGEIELPRVDPLEVEGNLSMAGSSTVFPLSRAISDRFIEYGYAGLIQLNSIGSGGGFELFCEEGTTDISNASRPIKDEEIQACGEIGRSPIEFRVGTDALAVVVNLGNRFATDVTKEELAALFTARKWSDVNPNWPDEDIERFVPGEDSGTFDFFVEEVLDEDASQLLNAPNTEFSEDDEYIKLSVETNSNAIGFMGYAYYAQDADKMKILSLEFIRPSAEAIEEGNYILSRPLLIYSDANIIRNKPQVGDFIAFFLNNVNQIIEEVGYFPSSPKALDESERKLLQAISGEEIEEFEEVEEFEEFEEAEFVEEFEG